MKPIVIHYPNPIPLQAQSAQIQRAVRRVPQLSGRSRERARLEVRTLIAEAAAREAEFDAANRRRACAVARWRRAAIEGRSAARLAAMDGDKRRAHEVWSEVRRMMHGP